MGEQHLRGMQAMALKCGLIDLHQAHLADRRHRLQFVQCTRADRAAEALHAGSHRT